MRTPIVDGRSIDQFIPRDLRGMFYNHPMPEYKYAIHDGYAPYGFSTDGLVLYLPLWALGDSSFKSVDAYRHTCDCTDALWRPSGHYFDGSADIDITSALTTVLSTLTVGTVILWYRPDTATPGAQKSVFTLGDTDANEYFRLSITTAGEFTAGLAVAGAWKWSTTTDAVVFGDTTWACVGVTQDAISPILYVNGSVPAQTFGVSTDKTGWLASATGLDNGYVGCQSFNGWGKLRHITGYIGEVRIHNRALTPQEMQHDYLTTRWRYT